MTASKAKAAAPGPPSPSASFYDVSDDEEGEYSTIAHSSSGRGVKLLFSKSKVRSTHSLGLCEALPDLPAQHSNYSIMQILTESPGLCTSHTISKG